MGGDFILKRGRGRTEHDGNKSRAHCAAQLWGRHTHGLAPWPPARRGHSTHLAKLARFCVTLAMRVRVRAVRSSGYSCSRLKSEGDMMAGQRKRRNREALMSRSLMSGRPRLLHSCRHEANTSFSSRGKTLGRNRQEWAWWSGRVPGQVGAEQGPASGSNRILSSNPDSYELALLPITI